MSLSSGVILWSRAASWRPWRGRQITVLAVAPGWVRTIWAAAAHRPLSVEESVRGIVDMLDSRAGTGRHGFVDHRGREVAW